MHVPNHLKQLTHHTTQVAVSTGFLASALVGGGCAAASRDDDLGENPDVDAGGDAIVESIDLDTVEAASHTYHAPPAGSEPVVIPLDLEDAPTTLPPPTAAKAEAQAAPREAPAPAARGKAHTAGVERRPARGRASQEPGRLAGDEGCDEWYQAAVDAVSRASRHKAEREALAAADAGPAEAAPVKKVPRRRPSARRPLRDPIANSFVPTVGRSTLPSTYTGGRTYY